jgi:hypothetical protein
MRTPGVQAVLSAWLLVSVALSTDAVSAPSDGGSSVAGAPAEQQPGKTHLHRGNAGTNPVLIRVET